MDIKKSVESGKYFEQAMSWYESKYLSYIAERSIFILLSVIMLVNLAIVSIKILSLPSASHRIPFIKYIENSVDEIARIRHLDYKQQGSPQISVAEYLISKYIENYQSFNVKTMEEMIKYVKNQSSRKVYKKFQDYLNISNPESPILKYQMHTKRLIDIQSVSIYNNKQLIPEEAQVIFKATYYRKGKSVGVDFWEANLSFTLSDINLVVRKFTPLNFLITNIEFSKK
jgi:type IV secretion system protein VirB8